MATKETGIQFLARLGGRPSLMGIEPVLFGNQGPQLKDVIEIFGGEGTGKTEMLVHLMTRCILPQMWRDVPLGGRQAGLILIDLDHKFSILHLVNRLEKFVLKKVDMQMKRAEIKDGELDVLIQSCLKRLHLVQCCDSAQFVLSLKNVENLICTELNISTIMVDSISAFYWTDKFNGGDSLASQEANTRYATEILSKFVNTYNLVIFVTKAAVYKKKTQGDHIEDKDENGMLEDLELTHSEFMPKAWQRLVSHRLIVVKDVSHGNGSFVVGGDCVRGNTGFQITTDGIQFE